MMSERPTTKLKIIIATAMTESRAIVACFPSPSITAQIKTTSIKTIDSVNTSVPYGSPSFRARCSACRITASAQAATSTMMPARRAKITGMEVAEANELIDKTDTGLKLVLRDVTSNDYERLRSTIRVTD